MIVVGVPVSTREQRIRYKLSVLFAHSLLYSQDSTRLGLTVPDATSSSVVLTVRIDHFIVLYFCICNSAVFYGTVFYIHMYFTVSVQIVICMFSFRAASLINVI